MMNGSAWALKVILLLHAQSRFLLFSLFFHVNWLMRWDSSESELLVSGDLLLVCGVFGRTFDMLRDVVPK